MQLKVRLELFQFDETQGEPESLFYTVAIPGGTSDEDARTRLVEAVNGIVDFESAISGLCAAFNERQRLLEQQRQEYLKEREVEKAGEGKEGEV